MQRAPYRQFFFSKLTLVPKAIEETTPVFSVEQTALAMTEGEEVRIQGGIFKRVSINSRCLVSINTSENS